MHRSSRQLRAAGLLWLWAGCAFALSPTGYYDTVDTSSPQALRQSLHEVIDDHVKYPYSSSSGPDTWEIIELADEDPANSNNILDVYRNRSHPKSDHWSSGNTSGWNREHVWPKSYGFTNSNDSCNYPYTDVHHLFASNGDYNSARSNLLFNWVPVVHEEYPVDNAPYSNYCWNCDQYQDGDWEVWDDRRGDIARAMFYMDVRYEGDVNADSGCVEHELILTNDRTLIAWNSRQNFSPAHMAILEVLREWHQLDPPDAREMWRNDVVHAYQDNRNPFIDHPEWVEAIWASDGGGGGGGGDTTAPAAPTGLVANGGDLNVALDWDDNAESDLAGYFVHRSTSSGGPYSRLNTDPLTTSAFGDNTVLNDTTYYYAVSAIDGSGNESALSAEASATPTAGGGCVASSVHVGAIVPGSADAGKGFKYGTAQVTVLDDCGNAVSLADVHGTFSGGVSGSDVDATDASGVAYLQSGTTAKGRLGFDFCVDDVVAAGLGYEPSDNLESCDSY